MATVASGASVFYPDQPQAPTNLKNRYNLPTHQHHGSPVGGEGSFRQFARNPEYILPRTLQ